MYPDGMTKRDWQHIDGAEHHEACNLNEETRAEWWLNICPRHECLCGGHVTEAQFCTCECSCPTKEDIELEKAGL